MRQPFIAVTVAAVLGGSACFVTAGYGQDETVNRSSRYDSKRDSVQLGPRPFFLVDDMQNGRLKRQLSSCSEGPFEKTDFSIGHRGAALQFPEHTREAYQAGARMGAGVLECDVTFTKDLELVCRHAQNDLHTTTDILMTPLAGKCTRPFTPAVLGPSDELLQPASAECRTSDITLAEFQTLTGKMDAFNPRARRDYSRRQPTRTGGSRRL
jgi:glycerophosphoryl diester phosphodiesterase